ncbi:MAG: hypothetical protein IJ658_11080, partial [Kiritimatiellae bacterium]|nr:hypothetical protein [Kiritimatiellia bacterium]
MNDKLKTASRASCLMVLALALGGPRFVAASDALERVPPVGEPPSQAATNLPPLLRPATLTDAEGTPETGLVDPFRRRGEGLAGEPTESAPGKDGLLRTSLGEISSEFRILAITIPQDTNTPRSALIQFHTSDEPILVHEGDLVHVDRLGAHGRSGRAALRRGHTAANGRAVAPRPPQ